MRIDGSEFELTENRFDFTCASVGIVGISCHSPAAPGGDTALDTTEQKKIETPRQYHVIILNDDYTPVSFVENLLQRVFGMSALTAAIKTLEIHRDGKTVCGTYGCDIAEAKAAQVIGESRKNGHPLHAITQPV